MRRQRAGEGGMGSRHSWDCLFEDMRTLENSWRRSLSAAELSTIRALDGTFRVSAPPRHDKVALRVHRDSEQRHVVPFLGFRAVGCALRALRWRAPFCPFQVCTKINIVFVT